MRNALVGALIYEFMFEVYRKMDHDRKIGFISTLPDENGTLREAFYHDGTGHWEWISSALHQVGVVKPLQTPARPWARSIPGHPSPQLFYYPVMPLDECEATDFSTFESFDNYCVAMFSFEYLNFDNEMVDLDIRSPRFLESVASQDDIFVIEDSDHVRFDDARFQEKVMTRWRGGLDNRNIRPKSGA